MTERDIMGKKYIEGLKLKEYKLKIIFDLTWRGKRSPTTGVIMKYSTLRNTVMDLRCRFDNKCKRNYQFCTCNVCKLYNRIKNDK